MSVFDGPFLNHELLRRTSIFGLPLWILIVILVVGLLILLLLFTIFLCIIVRRRRRKSPVSFVRLEKLVPRSDPTPSLSNNVQDTIHISVPDHQPVPQYSPATPEPPAMVSDRWSSQASGKTRWTGPSVSTSKRTARRPPDVSNEGWGHWYTLKELEAATNGFAEENVIEKGGYGIVYHGVLRNKTLVAVKDLLNDRGQAERDFQVEVEANGRVRHKNLVSLLGYCIDGAYRMLVYEYLDNGNLEQWLYGNVGQESPLTWDIRMKIILGTAKCLGYLHEGLEPKVVHRDVKSSNILLDQQWNPKVSDFGLAKFLGSERTYVSTRVMGTLGYVAPEYACTGKLNEMSDVYSFGILMMEIISGRTPVDYNRRPGEVNLVDWLKTMVGNRRSEQVVDPKLPEIPSSKALKRVILVALRCVDPDATKRPKMGNVVNMLEGEDLLFREVRRIARETSCPRKN